MSIDTPTRYLLKPTDSVAIKVGKSGFGSFSFGDVDISNAITGATVTFKAGEVTTVTFTCVPGAITIEAEAADVSTGDAS